MAIRRGDNIALATEGMWSGLTLAFTVSQATPYDVTFNSSLVISGGPFGGTTGVILVGNNNLYYMLSVTSWTDTSISATVPDNRALLSVLGYCDIIVLTAAGAGICIDGLRLYVTQPLSSQRMYYYPSTIKNLTVALLDMFNEIVVYKYNSAGAAIELIQVPIQFGPIDKAQANKLENHYYDVNNVEHNRRFYQTLPRMALTMDGMSYSSERAAGVNEWRYWWSESIDDVTNSFEVFADYQPTPYDITFTLHIKTNKLDYLSQILENVLPYFNPKLFLRIKEFSFLNIERDIPVSITGPTFEFSDDMSNEDVKLTNATIGLTVEAYMYRPWTYSKIIKIINSKYFIADASMDVTSTTSGTSGLWMDTYNSTSGVLLTSAGELYPTSAIPLSGTYFSSGLTSNSRNDYYWFKGQLSAYS